MGIHSLTTGYTYSLTHEPYVLENCRLVTACPTHLGGGGGLKGGVGSRKKAMEIEGDRQEGEKKERRVEGEG